MMMGGVNSQTASDALALLQLLADPAAAEAVLQEIADKAAAMDAARKDIDTRADALNALATDLSGRENALALARTQFETNRAATEQTLVTRAADLAARTAVFDADSAAAGAKLATDAEAVKNRELAVGVLDAGLKDREAAVTARENAVGALEAAAQVVKVDYETKAAALEAILKPPTG